MRGLLREPWATGDRIVVGKDFAELHALSPGDGLHLVHDRAIAQQTDRIIEVTDGLVSQDVRNDYLAAPQT